MCIAHLFYVHINQVMSTGEIEILPESVEVYNVCQKLPFEIKDFVKVGYLISHMHNDWHVLRAAE